MKNNYIGTVDKIRMLKMFPESLVRFTLLTNNEAVNCIVSDKKISNRLLFLEERQTDVAVFGHYNRHNQLVVEKMMIRNPSSFEREYALS